MWKKNKLKILFASTELAPFARAGGLGSVMHDLPMALSEIGHDVRIVIPKYSSLQGDIPLTIEYSKLEVPTDNKEKDQFLMCNVWKFMPRGDHGEPVMTYFIDNEEYYGNRSNIYGYGDDPVRWAFFSRAIFEFLRVSDWVPDIIVANDWHTGFAPNYFRTHYAKYPNLSQIATLFAIHNLHFQGNFRHKFADEIDLDDGRSPLPAFEDPRLLRINGMRRGILYADAISTVSPTYAKEIMTEEFGEGLQDLLLERKNAIFGIINGINTDVWNPETDPHIVSHFKSSRLADRKANRLELAKRLNLDITDSTFVIGIVSRMSAQKGFDLLDPTIKSLLRELDIAVVAVGEGDQRYMEFFNKLQERYSTRVSVNFRFDPSLPHLIFAGSDAVLIPSKFEPSGLTQMEAMHYGAVPIVRKTGGLADTVIDYAPGNEESTGFVFEKFDSFSMLIAVMRAYENFKNKAVWTSLQKAGMKKDFSWSYSAAEYEAVFAKAKELHKIDILAPDSKITFKE